jgi:hypothetical protein
MMAISSLCVTMVPQLRAEVEFWFMVATVKK